MTSDLDVLIFIPAASDTVADMDWAGIDRRTTQAHFFQDISNPVTPLILCVWLSQPRLDTSGLLGNISWEPNRIVVLFCSYWVGMACRERLVTLLRSSKRPLQSMLWNWKSVRVIESFFFTGSPFHPMQWYTLCVRWNASCCIFSVSCPTSQRVCTGTVLGGCLS